MAGRAIAIVASGVEDTNSRYAYYRLQEAGFQVDGASRKKASVKGKHGLPMSGNVDAQAIKAVDRDPVAIWEGSEGPDRVRPLKNVLPFLRDLDRKGKLTASICHGPWVPISARIG